MKTKSIFPPHQEIKKALLDLIRRNGGAMQTAETYDPLAQELRLSEEQLRMTRAEYYVYSSGYHADEQPAWHNVVQWVRRELVDEGLLDRGAPRGIWRLA